MDCTRVSKLMKFVMMVLRFSKAVTASGFACRNRMSMTRIIMTMGMNENMNPNAQAAAYEIRSLAEVNMTEKYSDCNKVINVRE